MATWLSAMNANQARLHAISCTGKALFFQRATGGVSMTDLR